jgi:hypothetical protein
VDHDANLANHDTSLADPDTAVTDHDTSVPNLDPSLPEPNVASGIDEQAPSANRHSFLDDMETPLADQDGRSVDQNVLGPGAEREEDWQSGHGTVPPTQIDVQSPPDTAPPASDDGSGDQRDASSSQDSVPAEDVVPLNLEDLSRDHDDAPSDVSPGEPVPAADEPSHQP